MKKIISIILVFFLSGCYTKCGLHHEYYCNCKEYYDASGQYIKECPDSLPTQALKYMPSKGQTNGQSTPCMTPTLGKDGTIGGGCGN